MCYCDHFISFYKAFTIDFMSVLLVYEALNALVPQQLSDRLSGYESNRSLRSSHTGLFEGLKRRLGKLLLSVMLQFLDQLVR